MNDLYFTTRPSDEGRPVRMCQHWPGISSGTMCSRLSKLSAMRVVNNKEHANCIDVLTQVLLCDA